MATTLPVTEGFDEHTENVMVWSNHPGILALAPRTSYDHAELSHLEVRQLISVLQEWINGQEAD